MCFVRSKTQNSPYLLEALLIDSSLSVAIVGFAQNSFREIGVKFVD